MSETVDVLVLCGAAGVGKTTLAHEVAALLREANVPYALIDTDELDHVHPWPPNGLDAAELSRRNLASLWSTYSALGHRRLITAGVFVDLDAALEWLAAAVPGGRFTAVRLGASTDVLERRVRRREVGSGAEAQLKRTRSQIRAIADGPDVVELDTSDATVTELARAILALWRLSY